MNSFKRIIILLSALLPPLLQGCNPRQDMEAMLSDGTVRLSVKGSEKMVYNPLTCQMAFNRQKCTFRVLTDSMSDYFSLSLDALPTTQGEEVCGSISWTEQDRVESKNEVALSVVKLQGDKVWLWDDDQRILCVFKVLE